MTHPSSIDNNLTAVKNCKSLLEQLIAQTSSQELEAERTNIEQLAARLYKISRKRRRIEAARQRQLQDSNPNHYNRLVFNTSMAKCYMCQSSCGKFGSRQVPICVDCQELNQSKNRQTMDLRGRRALVTGGRTRIGYATALKLLRWGADVHITTRFPWDAADRFSQEPDWPEWSSRLSIYQADFRNLPKVLTLIGEWNQCLGGLDILINNAAISVKEPKEVLHRLGLREHDLKNSPNIGCYSTVVGRASRALAVQTLDTLQQSAELSFFTSDELASSLATKSNRFRWNQGLAETDPVEFVEMLLVNAHVPCMLASHLLQLMKNSPFPDRYIVNVTGTDGLFNSRKGQRHPQLNMSKAALNMMTRTSADEYAELGIFMNSVDTGWITNWAQGDVSLPETIPPLNAEDGASRILDPIAQSVQTSKPLFGHIWRNFEISEW